MISDKLRELRTKNGMSQEELAAKLHIVRQTVSKYEKGLSMPDAQMIIKLSEIFGVTAGELLGEEKAHKKNRNFVKPRKENDILKIIGKIFLGILICCLVFTIIQTIFGLGISLNSEITYFTVEI